VTALEETDKGAVPPEQQEPSERRSWRPGQSSNARTCGGCARIMERGIVPSFAGLRPFSIPGAVRTIRGSLSGTQEGVIRGPGILPSASLSFCAIAPVLTAQARTAAPVSSETL
jgi:hypothetical protein